MSRVTVHEYLFWLLLLVLVAHVGAALKHHVFDNDNVLRRMLPFGAPAPLATCRKETDS